VVLTSYLKVVVCVNVALFQQTVLPNIATNTTDVNCLLEQVRLTQ